MEDLPRQTNLIKRNGIYYFRVRVPLDLIEHLSKKEIKVSLQTANLKEAKAKLALEQLKAQEKFAAARRSLTKEALPSSTPIATSSLTTVEIERIVTLWYWDNEAISAKEDDLLRTTKQSEELRGIISTLEDDLAAYQSKDDSVDGAATQPAAHKIFTDNNIDITQQPPSIRNFAYQIVKLALIEQTNSSLSGSQFWLFTLYDKDEMSDLTNDQRKLLAQMLKTELNKRGGNNEA